MTYAAICLVIVGILAGIFAPIKALTIFTGVVLVIAIIIIVWICWEDSNGTSGPFGATIIICATCALVFVPMWLIVLICSLGNSARL